MSADKGEELDEFPDHREQLVYEMTGEHPADNQIDHGIKTMINDMLDHIPMAVPLLVGAIQVHCEQIVEQAEGIRMAEAENAAKGKVSFFNVEAMIRDADLMLKRLHKGTSR